MRVCRHKFYAHFEIIWKIIQHCSTHTKMPQQTLIKYCSNQQSCVQIRHCLVLPIDMIFSGIFFSCKTFVIDHYHSRGEKRRTSLFYANRWLPLFFSHTPRTLSTSINHHVFFLCARFLLFFTFCHQVFTAKAPCAIKEPSTRLDKLLLIVRVLCEFFLDFTIHTMWGIFQTKITVICVNIFANFTLLVLHTSAWLLKDV